MSFILHFPLLVLAPSEWLIMGLLPFNLKQKKNVSWLV